MTVEHLHVGEGMDVLVLAQSGLSRAYYSSDGPPAACWSKDSNFPHPNASDPQARRCIDCFKSVRGSSGANSTACKYNQRLAVVPIDQPDNLYQLYLSPASIFGKAQMGHMPWQQFVRHLKNNNSSFEEVVTYVYRDLQSQETKLFFRPVRPALEEDIKRMAAHSKEEIADTLEFTVPPLARNPFGTVEGFSLDTPD